MATSKTPSPAPAMDPASQRNSGATADLSGSMPAPRNAPKSKGRSRPAEGKSAESKPAEGLSTAKPLQKGKGKAGTEGAEQPSGGIGTASPAATAAEVNASRPGGSGTAGGAGAGQPEAASPAAPTGSRLSDEERQRRIAEAAYRRAQERGFGGDRHLEDWLEAEREVDDAHGRRR